MLCCMRQEAVKNMCMEVTSEHTFYYFTLSSRYAHIVKWCTLLTLHHAALRPHNISIKLLPLRQRQVLTCVKVKEMLCLEIIFAT